MSHLCHAIALCRVLHAQTASEVPASLDSMHAILLRLRRCRGVLESGVAVIAAGSVLRVKRQSQARAASAIRLSEGFT